jgi:hypothetical protein
MSTSGIADRFWRLTPPQRMLIAAFAAAAIAAAADPFSGVIDLIVRACFLAVFAALVERTIETGHGAPLDRRAFIAYLPLACASSTFFLARETAAAVARSGSLSNFFEAVVSLLGLLLVSVVIDARRVAAYDKWLRALRGWWVAFIITGILYSLLGLLPGRSLSSEKQNYAIAWTGLVGALVALSVVMWRDPAQEPYGELRSELEVAHPRRQPSVTESTPGATSTSTRTPVRSIRASHRAGRR